MCPAALGTCERMRTMLCSDNGGRRRYAPCGATVPCCDAATQKRRFPAAAHTAQRLTVRVQRRVASTRLCSYAGRVHRRELLELLAAHRPADTHEQDALVKTMEFVVANRECFERTSLAGHVTGSAWVVSGDGRSVVLLHHAKLGRWLQPGGHADGDADVARVAWREASEETSLRSLRQDGREIFDLDVHDIPKRGAEPAHVHYDVRFLFRADPNEAPLPSDESRDVRWLGLDQARSLAQEASIERMIRKTRGELA